MTPPLLFELRMAWRETRASWRKFLFLISAIALGVGSLTGIRGFSVSLGKAISRSARELIAADVAVRFNSLPAPEEMSALDRLAERGASRTIVTEILSMASAEGKSPPLLCSIKAVDPALYPFYGRPDLEPAGELRGLLNDRSAVVSREFLIRTRSSVGEVLHLGECRLIVAAVLITEPDRLFSGIELGPRILISRGALEKSGLIQFGSRAAYSYLYRLQGSMTLEEARRILQGGLKNPNRIADYRDPNPGVTRGLERTTNFLSLVGLLALLVGGLGVAMTIHTYLHQKLDSIAVVKCLGGRSLQIVRVYLLQGMVLGAVGCTLGLGLGYVVQRLFPRIVRDLVNIPTELEAAPAAAVQGFIAGMLTTALFLLPPLMAIRRVRPMRVFLRDMPETRLSFLERIRLDPMPLVTSLILIAGVILMAGWLAESLLRGSLFIAGLATAILILAAGARLLLFIIKRLPRPSSLVLRHGLKNLARPGSQITPILVAIGIGIAVVVTVYLIQSSLIPQIVRSAPQDFPNLFLLGITERDRTAVWEFLRQQPGVQDAGDPIPVIPGRLVMIDGKKPAERYLEPSQRRHAQIEFVLTWTNTLPSGSRIVQGRWWNRSADMPEISVGQHTARELKLSLGNILEFESSGQPLRGRITSIREVEIARPGSNNQFIFSPGALDALPASYVGGLRVEEARMVSLQASLFERFPNVTAIDVGQVLTRVQSIIDRIAGIIRFVAAFAIMAGVIILAASVAATRYQRVREAVILKTLGATSSQIERIHAMEFSIVGFCAGLIGCSLAALAADILLGRMLDTEFEMRWAPLAVGILATMLLAVATGWAASRGILKQRPFEVLREN